MPPGSFGGSRPTHTAVKSDIPYIKCGVCEALAKNAYRQVKTARDALRPGKKLSEATIQDMVERMADPAKDEGEWVAKIDLVEDGSRLRLKEMPQVGKCGAECKTVQRVASELLQDHDTDMAEHLFQAKQTRAQFSNWLCYEASAACAAKPPLLPAGRAPGPAFEVLDPKEAELEKMLAGMKDAGLGGQVYDRESIMKGMGGMPGMGGNDDDDDEDDDMDEPFLQKPGGPSVTLDAQKPASKQERSTIEETLDKVKGAAGAAVDTAKEGLASAFESAKGLVAGLAGGKAADMGAQASELHPRSHQAETSAAGKTSARYLRQYQARRPSWRCWRAQHALAAARKPAPAATAAAVQGGAGREVPPDVSAASLLAAARELDAALAHARQLGDGVPALALLLPPPPPPPPPPPLQRTYSACVRRKHGAGDPNADPGEAMSGRQMVAKRRLFEAGPLMQHGRL
ncbi:hypothetical protein WJX81_004369 [Elliptochloris bilobata]|uniref:Uncharacterized protein n=1 Tax=Elliptochloris bilobata TaxID=381761 RepID=A0AAW1RJ77_9CHLO